MYITPKSFERVLACFYVHLTIVIAGLPSSVAERKTPTNAVLLIFKDTDTARVVSYLDGGSPFIFLGEGVDI